MPSLPVINLFLKKILATETDAFNRARIKILFVILLLSLVKVFIVLGVAYEHQQYFQIKRALIALVYYSALITLLLRNRSNLNALTHLMLVAGIGVIWSNVFISVQSINVVTLQFGFMIMLSSFYLLDRTWGIIYSLLSFIPVILFLIFSHFDLITFSIMPEELPWAGSTLIVILNFATITIGHYMYHQAFSENMTEKQSLNTQLKAAVEEANKHAQSKSDFLSTMSHELRTPLNMVIGMTELLLDSSQDKEQRENLKIMNFSATSLHTLINDILDFNKLDSGKLELEKISVNLFELIHNICAGLELQAKEKGLSLIVRIDKDLKDQFIITDPIRLTQIIYNLIGNGIKFTQKGSVTLELKRTAQASDRVQILFSVKDTGIGISEDKHSNIFESFTQASTNITRNFGGTGLGLSIVKRLLTLFESEIKLESTPGIGSHFFFEINFPIGQTQILYELAKNNSIDELKGLKLLLVEDNPINTYLMKKLCLRWKVELAVVSNGVEAVNALHADNYDMILMDIHMPEMDGYEATKIIRKMNDPNKADIPIIAITASVSDELEMKIKEVGMNDYIRKPFNTKELYGRLKNSWLITANSR